LLYCINNILYSIIIFLYHFYIPYFTREVIPQTLNLKSLKIEVLFLQCRLVIDSNFCHESLRIYGFSLDLEMFYIRVKFLALGNELGVYYHCFGKELWGFRGCNVENSYVVEVIWGIWGIWGLVGELDNMWIFFWIELDL